ncbi:MAG: histidine kinase dimerization/phospho-acceptor domain-containing protein, partial [Halocynthiibacter sp.]
MTKAGSLRRQTLIWCVLAALAGGLATGLWVQSQALWQAHLMRAFARGAELYGTLADPTDAAPEGMNLYPVPAELGQNGAASAISRLPGLPTPAFETSVSILAGRSTDVTGPRLSLRIFSAHLRYPVGEIESTGTQSPAAALGAVARVLASYCSSPVVFARFGDGGWVRIDGDNIWGCAAQPADRRLLAVLGFLVVLAILVTQISEVSGRFQRFASDLRKHAFLGGAHSYETEGPRELQDTMSAVNEYFALERERLEKRALLLSGVSHDLGTPATRLRLRTELIEDPVLREKLEADIDQMTGMIESVLTYTRSEMDQEPAQELSLLALIKSVVDDYADVGQPERLLPMETQNMGQ